MHRILNGAHAIRRHLERRLCALPGRRVTQQDQLVLLAHIMDVIRDFSTQFRGSPAFLPSRIGPQQRSAAFARDLMDFVSPDMPMADYLHGINEQLAEKREVCRVHRSRRRALRGTGRTSDQFGMVSYDLGTRTIYASDAGNSLALLDAVLHIERSALGRGPYRWHLHRPGAYRQ